MLLDTRTIIQDAASNTYIIATLSLNKQEKGRRDCESATNRIRSHTQSNETFKSLWPPYSKIFKTHTLYTFHFFDTFIETEKEYQIEF